HRLLLGWLARVLFAERDGRDGLVVLVFKIQQNAGIGPLPRQRKLQARQLRSADFLALNDLQVAGLEKKFADLGKIGRIIVAFAHAPEVILFDQVQFIRALLDADMGDVIDREGVAEQLLARALLAGAAGFVAVHLDVPAGTAQDDQEDNQN